MLGHECPSALLHTTGTYWDWTGPGAISGLPLPQFDVSAADRRFRELEAGGAAASEGAAFPRCPRCQRTATPACTPRPIRIRIPDPAAEGAIRNQNCPHILLITAEWHPRGKRAGASVTPMTPLKTYGASPWAWRIRQPPFRFSDSLWDSSGESPMAVFNGQ